MDMKVRGKCSCTGAHMLILPPSASLYSTSLLPPASVLAQLRGMYAARQLSFTGVTFSIRDVSLTDKFIEMYDSSVDLVSASSSHVDFFRALLMSSSMLQCTCVSHIHLYIHDHSVWRWVPWWFNYPVPLHSTEMSYPVYQGRDAFALE